MARSSFLVFYHHLWLGMALHGALFLPEIVEHICVSTQRPAQGEDSVPGRLERQTLASLARVCRTFSEPALRTLWRDIPNFSPLLRLFPGCKRIAQDPDEDNEALYTYVSPE